MNNRALYFSQFVSVNESSHISKKDVGMIGPLPGGEVKFRVAVPHINLKRVEEGDNCTFEMNGNKCSIPKKCMHIATQPGFDTITFDTNMNWFKTPANMDSFSKVWEDYISGEYRKLGKRMNSLEEDVNILSDYLGIPDDVKDFDTQSPLEITGFLDNGMEFELEKETPDDLVKNFRVYLNADTVHPLVKIKRKGNRFNCVYRTPCGNFECKHDSLGEIGKNPIDRYLLNVCIEKDNSEDSQRDLVDHLMKLFKYHTWKNQEGDSKEKIERHLEERKELKRIMKMLENTIPSNHIEEMYTDARSKFISQ